MDKTLILRVFLVIVILLGSSWLGYDLYTNKPVIVEEIDEEKTQEETENTIERQTAKDETAERKTFSKYGYEFMYPSDWTLSDSGNNSPGLTSPDYKESGGRDTAKIEQGAQIYVTQNDLPRFDITADSYLSNPVLYVADAHKNGRIVLINGDKVVQYEQPSTGYDYTDTVFFRKNGTKVTVHIIYPKGDNPYEAEYKTLLDTVKVD